MKKMEEHLNEMVWRQRPCCLLCYILPREKKCAGCKGVFEGQDKPFKVLLQVLSRRLFFITTVTFRLKSCGWFKDLHPVQVLCMTLLLTSAPSLMLHFPLVAEPLLSASRQAPTIPKSCLWFLHPFLIYPFQRKLSIWPPPPFALQASE